MKIICEHHGMTLVLGYIVHSCMIAMVWRNKLILVAIEDDWLQTAVVGYCLAAELQFVGGQRLEVDVET